MPFGTPTVFIQVWVDINSVQNGTTNGIYLVDNRIGAGSQNEGTPNLVTSVSTGSTIQWNVYNIDPNSSLIPELQAIGNAVVWGASGQPEPDHAGGFVGQALVDGTAGYQISLNVPQAGGSGVTVNVNPAMTVQ